MSEAMNEDSINITLLPEALIAHALEWLPFSNRRCYFSCSLTLLRSCHAYEALLQRLTVHGAPPLSVLHHWINLTSLDVGAWATDDLMRHLQHEQAVPHLKHLSMVKSMRITDAGLEYDPSYYFQHILQDKLVNLTLIRRQPKWMDGIYDTTLEHPYDFTYWADGTFYFERNTFGYACDVFQWSDDSTNHLGVKLQSTNNDTNFHGGRVPENMQPYFRPGVSLLRVPGENAILVATLALGLFPPKDYPQLARKETCPLGACYHKDTSGNVLENNDENRDLRYVLISHITMRPLQSLMPHEDLWSRIEHSFRRVAKVTKRNWTNEKFILHERLDGTLEDFEAIQQYYL